MNTSIMHAKTRIVARTLIALVVLGSVVNAGTGSVLAGQTGPAPTVDNIVVDSFDCETGVLTFHVTVGNVPHVPDGTSGFDYPLKFGWESTYSAGSDEFSRRADVWSPPADQSPYSGRVDLALSVPPKNVSGVAPGTGIVETIYVYVEVGYFGFGIGGQGDATDSTSLLYEPDCDGNSGQPSFIQQLIAVLIRILTLLFNR